MALRTKKLKLRKDVGMWIKRLRQFWQIRRLKDQMKGQLIEG